MRLRFGIYGGTFNPPHIGHIRAAAAAQAQLNLDVLYIVPAGIPPHKELPSGSPTNDDRLEMARLSFFGLPFAEVSDLEQKKEGISYTSETLDWLLTKFPDSDIYLIMGSDMFLTLETWKNAGHLLDSATPAALSRNAGEAAELNGYAAYLFQKFKVKSIIVESDVIDISSTELRKALPMRGGNEFIEEATYGYIIENRLYSAKPDFDWLRARVFERMKPKRISHTIGCEAEAVQLAARWGGDENEAREAAILHDITKHLDLEEQLQLCKKYDIMTDNAEKAEVKLLHAKTGAALAGAVFGVSKAVADAILWHTTGKADMSLLEKIIYIADYIEPTREFDGVDGLRRLAYADLDSAVAQGLRMSIEDMSARGITPHLRTKEAIDWLLTHCSQYKGE